MLSLLRCLMAAPSLIAPQHNACGIPWCETCQTSQTHHHSAQLHNAAASFSAPSLLITTAKQITVACVVRQPHFCHAAVASACKTCTSGVPILNAHQLHLGAFATHHICSLQAFCTSSTLWIQIQQGLEDDKRGTPRRFSS